MSAKQLTVFVPASCLDESIPNKCAKELSLEIDEIPPELGLSYQFSARRGAGRSYLLIEWRDSDAGLIDEILNWEKPSEAYKSMLANCKSSLTIYYRERSNAKDAIFKLGAKLQKAQLSKCVVENGEGCLLKLEDIVNYLQQEPQWSWERDEFPDLAGVATSEWR